MLAIIRDTVILNKTRTLSTASDKKGRLKFVKVRYVGRDRKKKELHSFIHWLGKATGVGGTERVEVGEIPCS